MLQIATGKLFTRETERENHLRGVLFTNLHLGGWPAHVLEAPLFGRILQASDLAASPKTLIYEFTERIETPKSGPLIILSHCVDPYLQDMATIVSFALNCTCSPDIDLVRRLTSGQRGIATGEAPRKFVRRVFDKEVYPLPGDLEMFVTFVNHLLGLHRKTYLGVMRAIRTYVTGLHRVFDDLELAYTLLVAAGESLTQDFDGHTSDWESVSEDKRFAIDKALDGASSDIAQKVRDAVLSFEHTALSRRFQAFVGSNVASDYFKGPFEKDSHPVGRSELPEVLAAAYKVRSQYVHQLLQLPDMVTLGNGYVETVLDGRCKMLTLQGLSRLMRHVIMNFILRQPTIDSEPYDYMLELPGVMRVPLAPSYWISRVDGDISEAGRNKLEGFLEELAGVLMNLPGATLTDISEVLEKFVAQAQNMKLNPRRPYLAMLVMFNAIIWAKQIPRSRQLEALIEKDLDDACSEALVAHVFFEEAPKWSLEDHYRALQNYRSRRRNKSGIRFPRLFEAAIALEVAERYRDVGLFDRCREVVVEAADDYPEHTGLRMLAESISMDEPLRWQEVLLPRPEPNDQGAS